MRSLVAALVIACGGCAFDPSGLGGNGPTDDAGSFIDAARPDAPPPAIDAAIDARMCSDVDSDGTCDSSDSWDCGPTRPSISFEVNVGTSAVFNTSIDSLGPQPVTQLGANQTTGISIDLGSNANRGGAYRIGEASGRFYGCRTANDLVITTTWTLPIGFTSRSSANGVVIPLVVEYTTSCSGGTGWSNGTSNNGPTGPIIGYYCISAP